MVKTVVSCMKELSITSWSVLMIPMSLLHRDNRSRWRCGCMVIVVIKVIRIVMLAEYINIMTLTHRNKMDSFIFSLTTNAAGSPCAKNKFSKIHYLIIKYNHIKWNSFRFYFFFKFKCFQASRILSTEKIKIWYYHLA
jgi:hypothetical protein